MQYQLVCVSRETSGIYTDGDEREGEKEDDFEGDSILTIAQWERDARSTSNESIRAQDSLVHVYAFIHISRAIEKHIKPMDIC